MNIGLEQLIWAIVILIFIVASALKNLQKKRRGTQPTPAQETPKRKPKSNEELRRFLEELMGIERPREEPPIRRETEEITHPVVLKQPKKKVKPVIIKEKLPEVPKGALVHLEGLKTPSPPEIPKTLEHPVAPPRYDLKRAIIFSEIIGPPLAKRRTHRLF